MREMNPYEKHLEVLFNRINEIRHISLLIIRNLKRSVKEVEKNDNIKYISGSALIISDWSAPSDNGWELNFHTGVMKTTEVGNYRNEVELIISQECCNAFVQSFESLERFFKDCFCVRYLNNNELREYTINKYPHNHKRENLKGGRELYDLTKMAIGSNFEKYSLNNEQNIQFKEFWNIISDARHSIVHANSMIRKSKTNKSKYYEYLFDDLFCYTELEGDMLLIKLDEGKMMNVLKRMSEFAYQIFKLYSIEEKLNWEIFDK